MGPMITVCESVNAKERNKAVTIKQEYI